MCSKRSRSWSRLRTLIGATVVLVFAGWLAGCGSDDTAGEGPYVVGGQVHGLEADGLILLNNGDDDLEVAADDEWFIFDTELEDGEDYNVTVSVVPPEHSCDVTNGSGTIEGANVDDIQVRCEVEGSDDPDNNDEPDNNDDPDEPDEPHFSVDIDLPASSLQTEEGGMIVLAAEVENTGDEGDTQDITLSIDGDVVDTASGVELDGGSSTSVTLEWDTTGVEVQSYAAQVASDDAFDTATVTVFEHLPFFEVAIDLSETTVEVFEEETVMVEALIENVGGADGAQDIVFEVLDQQFEQVHEGVELGVGDSTRVNFEWETSVGDEGQYTVEVRSEDETSFATITVEELPTEHFEVSINEAASILEVEEAQTVTVEVEIENTGGETGTQDIVLELDGVVVDSASDIELEPEDKESVTLHWDAAPGSEGVYDARVLSEDSGDFVTVTVDRPTGIALFAVSIDRDASELFVDEGETVLVVVELDNRGDVSGTQDIELDIDGVDEDFVAADVELEGEQVDTVTFEWETDEGDSAVYSAEVTSDDDSDTAQIGVVDPDADVSVSGTVLDAEDEIDMEGVEVIIVELGSDTVAASTIVESGGDYDISDIEGGAYEMFLQAPGLEPNHTVEELDGTNVVELFLVGGEAEQDFTVDWLRSTDLLIDGGRIDFEYDNPDGQLAVELPGCVQQPDGSWEPEEIEDDSVEVTLDPEGECFQIKDVGIDLLTGVFEVDVSNILFPDITVYLDDLDDAGGAGAFVDGVEADLDWLMDDVGGAVDFTDGSLNVDIDTRLLFGGTVESMLEDIDFGSRDGNMDCQMTRLWGGDVTDPTEDSDDEQIGDYLHEPLELRMTTGDSGPQDVTGEPYDSAERFFVTVDNAIEVDRFSEGSNGNNDPGGASCGSVDVMGFFQEDVGGLFNEQLDLPAQSGSVYMEFNFLLP